MSCCGVCEEKKGAKKSSFSIVWSFGRSANSRKKWEDIKTIHRSNDKNSAMAKGQGSLNHKNDGGKR